MPKLELTPATDLEEVTWESIAPEGPQETLLKLVAPVAAAAIAIAIASRGSAGQYSAGRSGRRSGDGGEEGLGFAMGC